MDSEILYKSIKTGTIPVFLDYSIVPESISANYCDLKRYGIKISKTTLSDGGGKIIETKQMSNVFYRLSDAEDFLSCAAKKLVEPAHMRPFVEKYIIEGLDRARRRM